MNKSIVVSRRISSHNRIQVFDQPRRHRKIFGLLKIADAVDRETRTKKIILPLYLNHHHRKQWSYLRKKLWRMANEKMKRRAILSKEIAELKVNLQISSKKIVNRTMRWKTIRFLNHSHRNHAFNHTMAAANEEGIAVEEEDAAAVVTTSTSINKTRRLCHRDSLESVISISFLVGEAAKRMTVRSNIRTGDAHPKKLLSEEEDKVRKVVN